MSNPGSDGNNNSMGNGNCQSVRLLLLWIVVQLYVVGLTQYEQLATDVGRPNDIEEQLNVPKEMANSNTYIDTLEEDIDADGPSRITKDPCLVVYHIPKTGGLTLLRNLESLADLLGWRVQKWYDASLRTPPQPIEYYNQSVINIGHLTPHFEPYTNTGACYKLTVLREPVDRVVSAFYFHRQVRGRNWTTCLERKCRIWHEYHNDVVRRFAARGTAWNSYDLDKYLTVQDKSDVLDPSLLTDAKAFVKTLDFVCFLDELYDCIRRVTHVLYNTVMERDSRIDPTPTLAVAETIVNKNSRRREVDETIQKQITQANSLDIQLYKWALNNVGNQ